MLKGIWKKLTVLMLCISLSCAGVVICLAEETASTAETNITASDYFDDNNWLKIPEVKKPVDTFYIYPTAYLDPSEGAPDVCDIDNEILRSGAADVYEQQAAAYEAATNVFAPFYRQVNMVVAASAPAEEREALLQKEPKADLFAALDYYFENMNGGRPFILAGHSQGSQMMTYVLTEYMSEHPDYYSRMVAAYALGYSITDKLLEENPHLKFAEGEDDLGVIISWNTEGEGNADAENFVVEEGAIAINPLNWKRDETYAGKDECLGARIQNAETGEFEIIPEAADAQLNTKRGVVVTHTDVLEPMDEAFGFGPESYHGGDYSLWYSNIEANVQSRVDRYLSEYSKTDYSDSANWYKIPEITKDVDTFFIYPTVYGGSEEGDPDYASIDDPEIVAGVDMMYQMQACVFEESTNLYMPYYRQASMRIEIAAHQETGDLETVLTSIPYEDITAALDFYFENENDGRPFIIAGHSQGSAMTRLLLKTYFKDHPEYYERMVAAFVIGYSITKEDLEENPHLKFATGESDTGVIVSWNIEGQENVDTDADNIVVLKDGISINPINWKLDDTYAPASENLGSRILSETTGEYEITDIGADATVNTERGVVVTNADTESVDLTDVFGPQSFHTGDYSLYFMNIQDNVAKRIQTYFIEEALILLENEDYKAAIPLLEEAAKQGSAEAQNELGKCYTFGTGVEQSDEEAFKYFQMAADQGYAKSLNNVANYYAAGNVVDQDDAKAFEYYKLAADQGLPNAQCALGYYFENGIGVGQNLEEAVKYYKLAVAQGFADAQNNLALCYLNGTGIPQDVKEAIKLFQLAADQGNAAAQNTLGYCYSAGVGVEQDDEKALKYFRLSADQSDPDGLYNLGYGYYYGDGVEQDYEKAWDLFQQAAEMEQPNAIFLIGECYYEGKAVEKDLEEAAVWYRKALDAGYEPDEEDQKHLTEVMGDDYTAIRTTANAMETGSERAQITEEFIALMEDDPYLEYLVEKSISMASINNPDPMTNPVRSLEDYYDFLDWSATCMPWNILDGQDLSDLYGSIDQSLDYFYYLLDQPLPELAGKGYYYPCLEFHEPIASWCMKYASIWGEFLSTEESWNDEYYALACADESFGMNEGWYADTNIWESFNDWFSRKLVDDKQRPISDADIVSPADSTPQGIWSIDENSQIDLGVQLKSTLFYNVEQIIGEDSKYEQCFANGLLTHTFLDVNDYHRYHFPVSGKILEVRKISALDAVGGLVAWDEEWNRYVLYDENPGWQSMETRDCLIMDTEYGLVAILPIAMSQVSSCNWEDTVTVGASVEKGDPMGYFLFGGSDIVMIFQEGVNLELATQEHILMGEPYADVVEEQ